MYIRFAKADKTFIAHQVEQGFFTSETELVRARHARTPGKPFLSRNLLKSYLKGRL